MGDKEQGCGECKELVKVGYVGLCLHCGVMHRSVVAEPTYGNSLEQGDKAGYSEDCHYAIGGIEAMEVIKAKTKTLPGDQGFLAGCALKYLMRFPYKGKPIQDLQKARWYINMLIQEMEENTEGDDD